MVSVTLVVVLVILDGKRLIVVPARLPNAQNTRIRHAEVMAFASKILNVAVSVVSVDNHVRLALAMVCLVQVVWMKKHCFRLMLQSRSLRCRKQVHLRQRLERSHPCAEAVTDWSCPTCNEKPCSGHGTCDLLNKLCKCDVGYVGKDCSIYGKVSMYHTIHEFKGIKYDLVATDFHPNRTRQRDNASKLMKTHLKELNI